MYIEANGKSKRQSSSFHIAPCLVKERELERERERELERERERERERNGRNAIPRLINLWAFKIYCHRVGAVGCQPFWLSRQSFVAG